MRKAILSVSFFNVISAGLAFLINIFLARYLSIEIYGRINLLLSFTLIINTIGDLGLSNTNVIFNNKLKDEHSKEVLLNAVGYFFKKYFNSILIISGVLIIIFSLWFKLSYIEIGFLFFQGVLIIFFRFLLSFHQAFGNWSKFNVLNLSLNILKFLFLGLCFIIPLLLRSQPILSYDLVLGLLSLACIISFSLTLFFSRRYAVINRHIKVEVKLENEFNKIWYPLIGINIIIVLAMRSDTLIIQYFLGEKSLGIYSAANSLSMVFPLITNSIMQVLLKETSNKGTDYLKRIIELQKRYFVYITLVLFAIELLAYYLIPFIFGSQYEDSVIYFQILILAQLGGLIFTPLESYFYSKNTKFIFYLKGIQLVIILTFSISFVQSFGLFSVAIAVLLSRVIGWIILSIKSSKALKLL